MDRVESSDVEVIHPCPVCARHISYDTYETVLDETIVKKVQFIPACKSKESWNRRRKEYLLQRKPNNKSLDHDLDLAIECAIPIVVFIIVVCFVCL